MTTPENEDYRLPHSSQEQSGAYKYAPKVLKRARRRPVKHRKSMIWMLSHALIDPRIFLRQKKKIDFFSKKKYFFFEKYGYENFRPSTTCPSRAKTIITIIIRLQNRGEAFRGVQERAEAYISTQKHLETLGSTQKHEKA